MKREPAINPYESPAATEPSAPFERQMLPRRWGLWLMADSSYLALLAMIVAVPLVIIVQAVCVFVLSGDEPAPVHVVVSDVTVQLLMAIVAIPAAICLFALVLWIAPTLSGRWTMILGLLAALLCCGVPIWLGTGRVLALLSGGSSHESSPPMAQIVVCTILVLFAMHVLFQSAAAVISPLGRLQWNPAAEIGVQPAVRSWMRRIIEITLPEGRVTLEYDGRKMGEEVVRLDGEVVGRGRSFIMLAPSYAFTIGGRRCEVHVTAWPWLMLRSMIVAIDDAIVYREGF